MCERDIGLSLSESVRDYYIEIFGVVFWFDFSADVTGKYLIGGKKKSAKSD